MEIEQCIKQLKRLFLKLDIDCVFGIYREMHSLLYIKRLNLLQGLRILCWEITNPKNLSNYGKTWWMSLVFKIMIGLRRYTQNGRDRQKHSYGFISLVVCA